MNEGWGNGSSKGDREGWCVGCEDGGGVEGGAMRSDGVGEDDRELAV